MGNYYEIDYDFGQCSDETLAVVRELLKEGHYRRGSLALEEDKTVLSARICVRFTWEEDERFMRLLLRRVLLPEDTVLISAWDEWGWFGTQLDTKQKIDYWLLGLEEPVRWTGTMRDFVKRFFETDE